MTVATVSPRVVQRFWVKVDTSGVCWEWIASVNSDGYGTFNSGAGTVGAHRFAWQLLVGPVPYQLELDHLCVNRRCVNPDHLEPVSRQENLRRMGRSRSLYCLRGHRRSENRYFSGRPGCRTCTREDNRSRYVPAEPRGPVTHCKNGHEYTPENTYFQLKTGGRKSRQCRKCKVNNQRRYEARRNGGTNDQSARQPDGGTQAAA
ncbi:HNH endonuclease signature motif containing protein [Micromonospora sp. NPDC048935]|uniref:HNH endonuclease signature motif containing protein n=1 Tax=Micromonospora sp. NPDC048935 TaxID=3364262 RepID=UPI003714DF71